MKVGLIFDLFDDFPWQPGDAADLDAEYEPEATVQVLEAGIRLLGHDPVRIGTARKLLPQLDNIDIDAAVSISESYGSRNREAHAPVLLELAGIPYLGSDALTLSLSLDKAWTKDLVLQEKLKTPSYRVVSPGDILDENELPSGFPLFVKPRYEGAAMGITPSAKVTSMTALRNEVEKLHKAYRQDVIIEKFIEGSEFTVAVVGNDPPEALPVLQRAVERTTGIGLHALERKGVEQQNWQYDTPGELSLSLERELQNAAVAIYEKLECLDFARLDFRVDENGQPWFLEINPLPTFAPDGTFAILAELSDVTYPEWVASILAIGFRRLGLPVHTEFREPVDLR